MSQSNGEHLLRLSVGFTLDQLVGPRLLFDIVDTLIGVAAGQANVAPINADRDLQLRYATYEQPPPDDQRRPISVNALAQSLRMPFETVRRRLLKMTLVGACRSTPAGIVVPSQALFSPLHRGWMQRNHDLTEQLWRDASPALPALPPSAPGPDWTDATPLRLVARLAFDYVLRFSDLLIDFVDDDATGAAVWAAAVDANGSTTMQEIGRRAGLSRETARRRVHDLAERGLLTHTWNSVSVPAEALETAAAKRLFARNQADLVRLFAALDGFGVLDTWRAGSARQAA